MSFLRQCRKIVAIGRNYSEHAKELGSKVPKEPILFLKPPSSFLQQPHPIVLPKGHVIHHEVELAVVIGSQAKRVSAASAMRHVSGYALALDMTARDIQQQAMKQGLPWTVAKGYDTFTPISNLIQAEAIRNPHDLRLWCKVNGQMRQNGTTKDMVFQIPALLEYISNIMTLEEGDMILTGTPSGVGPVHSGDRIECGLETTSQELARIAFDIEE